MLDCDIYILGKGALGSSLEASLVENGFNIQIFGRNQLHEYPYPLKGILFICTDDKNIKNVVDELISERASELDSLMVLHCSGAALLEELSPLKNYGARLGVSHPIQTFILGNKASFKDVFVSVQTESDDVYREISQLFIRLGATTERVSQEEKMALHIAAVFTSNFLVSNLYASQRVLDAFNLPLASKNIFAPLYQQAIKNIGEKNLINALSGPAKRGDMDTIHNHETMLENHPELAQMYKILTNNLFDLIQSSVPKG